MRTMDFKKYVQRQYSNVTVRRGYKWANLKIGEWITLSDNGRPIENAVVAEITVKWFSEIHHYELKREHDPDCTTRGKLLKAMKAAYPDFDFEEVVTLVTYVRTKS